MSKKLVVIITVFVLLMAVMISVNAGGGGSGTWPSDPFEDPTSTPVPLKCEIAWWKYWECPRPTSTPDPAVDCSIIPTLPWCN